jgi:hypothetical protein
VLALVSVGSGVVGLFAAGASVARDADLLLVAIVLGPIAFIAGLVGENLARTRGLSGGRLAILGIVLGLLSIFVGARGIGVL